MPYSRSDRYSIYSGGGYTSLINQPIFQVLFCGDAPHVVYAGTTNGRILVLVVRRASARDWLVGSCDVVTPELAPIATRPKRWVWGNGTWFVGALKFGVQTVGERGVLWLPIGCEDPLGECLACMYTYMFIEVQGPLATHPRHLGSSGCTALVPTTHSRRDKKRTPPVVHGRIYVAIGMV